MRQNLGRRETSKLLHRAESTQRPSPWQQGAEDVQPGAKAAVPRLRARCLEAAAHRTLHSLPDSTGPGLRDRLRNFSGQLCFHPRQADPSELQLVAGVLQVGSEGVVIPLPPLTEANDCRITGGRAVGVVDSPQQVPNPEATFTMGFTVHHPEAGREGDHRSRTAAGIPT